MQEPKPNNGGNPFNAVALGQQQLKGLSHHREREVAAEHIEALAEFGYTVVEGLLSQEKIRQVATEMDRIHLSTPKGRTDFEGLKTKRIYNPLNKTRCIDALCTDARILAIIEGYLEDQIQLSSVTGITILPGETAQTLHRDDSVYPLPRPRPPLMVGTLWAIDAYNQSNGATRLIPKSQNNPDHREPPHSSVTIKMTAGSVLLFDGGLWHGGGANESHSPRRAFSLSYCRAWLRQQENAYLSIPLETVRTLSRPLQCLLGYTTASIMLGQVERGNPIHWFDSVSK